MSRRRNPLPPVREDEPPDFWDWPDYDDKEAELAYDAYLRRRYEEELELRDRDEDWEPVEVPEDEDLPF